MSKEKMGLNPGIFFDADPCTRRYARELYKLVKDISIISPHSHVDARLFADENTSFKDPAELFIIPDHYLYRMLYSQGISLESLGIGAPRKKVETNHRKIWKKFAENFYLFRATPTGIWLRYEFEEIFGIKKKLSAETAMEIYDEIDEKIKRPEYSPRRLFERFRIEKLCTTDAVTDTLKYHKLIKASDWRGDIRPSLRPDGVINAAGSRDWRKDIDELSEVTRVDIHNYTSYINALRQRMEFFKKMGATSIDIGVLFPHTHELSLKEREAIFQKALKGQTTPEDREKFTAHMLIEMAGMSVEHGLVMQLHPGSLRDHNEFIYKAFGKDKGSDIPIQVDFTRGLRALLNKYGNDPKFTLIVFTLDEDTYSRELAPLAGLYPAMRLGPPWWFHDSINGISRYLDRVTETAGIYNLAGFNDDTRAFCSIPARHDVWRRCCSNWLARLLSKHIISIPDAKEMILDLSYRLAKRCYRL
jgi:glucuronate isomerase